jgi:hypothetical protein
MKWLLWSVLAIGLLACGDDDGGRTVDAGDNDAGATDAATQADAADGAVVGCGPLTGRTTECDTCLQANCCTALAACGNDIHCSLLVPCLRACDEPDAATDCMSACIADHGVPSTYNPLVLCGSGTGVGEGKCKTECPFSSP